MEPHYAKDLSRDALGSLKRLHEDKGGWQQRKSEFTQHQLLEATVTCIVRFGFARVRTRDIAEEAGLSRGAIVHHFANKRQLFEKALEYVFLSRIEEFRAAIENLPTMEARAAHGLDVYWEQLQSPYFVAVQELQMAARSNPALAAIMKPQRERFMAQWRNEAARLFPEWSSTGPMFDLVMMLTRYLMEGMALQSWFEPDARRENELLTYLKLRLSDMRDARDLPGSDMAVEGYLALRPDGAL
ncbi:MAG: helix-turn-helix domain-containing protein [Pseudomonadota bacterium]